MNFRLCADIDPTSRFVQDDEFRVHFQPPGEECLLLVAATESTDGLFERAMFDLKSASDLSRKIRFGLVFDPTGLAEAMEHPDTGRRAEGMIEDEALPFAFFGNIHDTELFCVRGPARGIGGAVQFH